MKKVNATRMKQLLEARGAVAEKYAAAVEAGAAFQLAKAHLDHLAAIALHEVGVPQDWLIEDDGLVRKQTPSELAQRRLEAGQQPASAPPPAESAPTNGKQQKNAG